MEVEWILVPLSDLFRNTPASQPKRTQQYIALVNIQSISWVLVTVRAQKVRCAYIRAVGRQKNERKRTKVGGGYKAVEL